MITAYLAGPDVFLPEAVAHAGRKIAICARHGIVGRAPLNEDLAALAAMSADEAWWTIYRKDMEMMAACDIVIANLTPFRGASADAGTLIEVGWFLGQGRPVFGYSNVAAGFAARSRAQVAAVPDRMAGVAVEGFGLADNLMIEGAVKDGSGGGVMRPEGGHDLAFDSLELFEACVATAGRAMARR